MLHGLIRKHHLTHHVKRYHEKNYLNTQYANSTTEFLLIRSKDKVADQSQTPAVIIELINRSPYAGNDEITKEAADQYIKELYEFNPSHPVHNYLYGCYLFFNTPHVNAAANCFEVCLRANSDVSLMNGYAAHFLTKIYKKSDCIARAGWYLQAALLGNDAIIRKFSDHKLAKLHLDIKNKFPSYLLYNEQTSQAVLSLCICLNMALSGKKLPPTLKIDWMLQALQLTPGLFDYINDGQTIDKVTAANVLLILLKANQTLVFEFFEYVATKNIIAPEPYIAWTKLYLTRANYDGKQQAVIFSHLLSLYQADSTSMQEKSTIITLCLSALQPNSYEAYKQAHKFISDTLNDKTAMQKLTTLGFNIVEISQQQNATNSMQCFMQAAINSCIRICEDQVDNIQQTFMQKNIADLIRTMRSHLAVFRNICQGINNHLPRYQEALQKLISDFKEMNNDLLIGVIQQLSVINNEVKVEIEKHFPLTTHLKLSSASASIQVSLLSEIDSEQKVKLSNVS